MEGARQSSKQGLCKLNIYYHCEITLFRFPPFIKILTDSTIIKTKSQFI